MTNKDLYRALSDVDPSMVLDAQPAPGRTHPAWAKAVAIAACACVTLSVLVTLPFISKWAEPDTPVVPGETVSPEQTEQQTETPTAGQVIGDPIQGTVFLYVPSAAETPPSDNPFQSLSPSFEYGLYTAKVNTTFEQLEKTQRLSPFSNTNITYLYSQGKLKNSSTKDFGSFYSIYDRYANETEWVDYLHGTDKVKFYVNFDMSDDSTLSGSSITEDQALIIAQKLIASMVSKEYLSCLTLDHIRIVENEYSILFIRYVHGYPTDETVSINISKTGDLVYYNGYNTEKYDTIMTNFTLESLKNANEKLLNKVNSMNLSNAVCSPAQVITSSDGVVFMEMIVSYDTTDETGGLESIITNVE